MTFSSEPLLPPPLIRQNAYYLEHNDERKNAIIRYIIQETGVSLGVARNVWQQFNGNYQQAIRYLNLQ